MNKACVFGGNIMTCQDLIQCDDQMDEFGNCLGNCKDGYTGEYCLEKGKQEVYCLSRVYTKIAKACTKLTTNLLTKISKRRDQNSEGLNKNI